MILFQIIFYICAWIEATLFAIYWNNRKIHILFIL